MIVYHMFIYYFIKNVLRYSTEFVADYLQLSYSDFKDILYIHVVYMCMLLFYVIISLVFSLQIFLEIYYYFCYYLFIFYYHYPLVLHNDIYGFKNCSTWKPINIVYLL